LGFYYILGKIFLSEATILRQLYPLFVVIMSIKMLNAKIHKMFIVLLLISFVGVILIIKQNTKLEHIHNDRHCRSYILEQHQ
jgi:drug/metabolite transporter (DMT)-like permease